jgi:hypothetical protein
VRGSTTFKNISLSIPPRKVDRDHGRVGVRQIVAGIRHHLRRGTAALRGIAFRLRAPVPGTHGKARRGRYRWHCTRHRYPAEEYHAQSPLYRGHVHRVLRLSAPAIRPRWPDILSRLRHARSQRYGGRSGGASSHAARELALVCPLPLRRASLQRRPARSPFRAAQEGLQPRARAARASAIRSIST